MRRFHSYGPVDPDLHYYVPREAFIEHNLHQLVGDDPTKGGHYITVWAPRQTGKSWLMLEVLQRIRAQDAFEVALLTMQLAKNETTVQGILDLFVSKLSDWFGRPFPRLTRWKELPILFSAEHFSKPVILIIDEFDALQEQFINEFANTFREIYISRLNERDKKSSEKRSLLHGLALIGVRSVLGIENQSGAPFNVQRSFHVPNLTRDEVTAMFQWYEWESGQSVELAVSERVFHETQGQPGLVGWLGELLTETYNRTPDQPLTLANFDETYAAAIYDLPNNNILNIISKADQDRYRPFVLDMFRTDKEVEFRYDDKIINYLYMNGVLDRMVVGNKRLVKFPSPFVQKRLFNAFAYNLFRQVGQLHDPFADMSDTVGDSYLSLTHVLRHYETYLQANEYWLFNNAPRRSDLRIYEAVYHFNLYRFLSQFMDSYEGQVYPEFPTGNGQIDLIVLYQAQMYGLEIKTFTNQAEYKKALRQAARYGQQLGLREITLAFFVEQITEANRQKFEVTYQAEAGLTVLPVFVATGGVRSKA